MGLSLEEVLIANQAEALDYQAGRHLEVWIKSGNKDDRYIYLDDEVGRVGLIVMSAIAVGSNSIELKASATVTLYRNDPIKFESGKIIFVQRNVTLVNETATLVSIYQSDHDIEIGEQSATYNMTPLFSAKEGGYPQISTTYAEAHNKNMGLYPVSQKIKENGAVTLTGEVNFNDPSLQILKDIANGTVNKLFVQLRHQFTSDINNDKNGEGFGAVEYWAVPYCGLSDTEATFINFSLQMEVIGRIHPYRIITGSFPLRYCPQDVIFLNSYHIEFTVVPEEDTSNYCPQDVTGFYDFATAPE